MIRFNTQSLNRSIITVPRHLQRSSGVQLQRILLPSSRPTVVPGEPTLLETTKSTKNARTITTKIPATLEAVFRKANLRFFFMCTAKLNDFVHYALNLRAFWPSNRKIQGTETHTSTHCQAQDSFPNFPTVNEES